MEIKKQDVGVWVKASEELPDSFTQIYMTRYPLVIYECKFLNRKSIDVEKNAGYDIEWLKPIKDVYVLTSDELAEIKRENYN